MQIANIRTRNDLIEFVKENGLGGDDPSHAVNWFVACCQATLMQDMRMKDVANLFMDGVTSIRDNPEAEVKEFLASFFEDVDLNPDNEEALEDAVSCLTSLINDHFDTDFI